MNALEIRDLTKHYTGFSLNHLNLTLPWGCIMGLVGENGAGKSTTIKLILNTISRDGGTVTILGRDNRENLCLSKEEIGVVLDEAYFPESLNALQVGKVMAKTYRQWDSGLYETYLTRFGLPEKKQFKDFSRGMKMKLAIAAALSHRPKLLLLDEATAGLDPIVRDEILEVFAEFTRDEGHSILICSHIVSDLEKLCDYVAFLHQGRLLFCEEKDALIDSCGIWQGTREELSQLDRGAVMGREVSPYGARALVRRDRVPAALPLERPSLEDIILLQVKGARGQ